jgi:hypothetical protein
LAGREKQEVENSTTIWIGSTVIASLGLLFGSAMTIVGSLVTWRSDSLLGLYSVNGWNYENLTPWDGRITLVLGALTAVFILVGLLAQNRAAFMGATVTFFITLVFSIYEVVYISTRPGITGAGTGLYMVVGAGVAGFMCSLGGYLMMAERHRQRAASRAENNVSEVA